MVLRSVLLAVLAASLAGPAAAQERKLSIDAIYGAGAWTRLNGTSTAYMGWVPDGGPWIDDRHYLWPASDTTGATWLRVEAQSGAVVELFRIRDVESALIDAGASADQARRAARRRPTVFDRRFEAFLLALGDDYYRYDIARQTALRLTTSVGEKTEPSFSPDGQHVAFVKGNNLYVTSVAHPAEVALTSDGGPDLLNGTLDWVYSEELFGRGNHRGYWWSPDSSRIAFLRLDEARVPKYTLIDDLSYHPALEQYHYPKAGDPNPVPSLGVADVRTAELRWIDTTKYNDVLIVNVSWTPDAASVIFQIQDRKQSWLDLNRMTLSSGAVTTLLRESSDAWVERWQDPSSEALWLDDGSFLWLSERNGWRHLYHYDAGGKLRRQLTSGDWEVRTLNGVDASARRVYFSGTERSPVGTDLYAIDLEGGSRQRLVGTDGKHTAFFNPSRSLFLDSWSDASTPPQVRLYGTDNRRTELLRVVEANPVPSLKAYEFAKPEFVQVKARDGFVMEAVMIKPPDFDRSRRYPVYQFTYGGPHMQQVLNAWQTTDTLYNQLLAQSGVIVWMCDNRTASGKGVQSVRPLFRNLGQSELQDVEDCLDWLKRQPYVDASRIGIGGISYGAFMTLYAMTHSSTFKMGIADAAVSDWRTYDSIYTERYLGLPSENPDGYRLSSPRFFASGLQGELLLMHGSMDDNVHPQNASLLAAELQKAGKLFQMMIYPGWAHGAGDPQLTRHVRQTMLQFTLRNLIAHPEK